MILSTITAAKVSMLSHSLFDMGFNFGQKLLGAILIFIVGRFIIKWVNKLVAKLLDARNVDASLKSFLKSLVNILLMTMLILSIIDQLGIQLAGFAALLASAGVAIGMALSGNLQNFAGGIIILLFKPYKVGDYIESSAGANGTVQEIQIFHTVLLTVDNKTIYAPNGSMSSGVITNYSLQSKRRLQWTFGVDYGTDFQQVKDVLRRLIADEQRIMDQPEPFIELSELADSSVNVTVRVWVKSADYWDVYYSFNRRVYATFNAEGIEFPFPQLTVHRGA